LLINYTLFFYSVNPVKTMNFPRDLPVEIVQNIVFYYLTTKDSSPTSSDAHTVETPRPRDTPYSTQRIVASKHAIRRSLKMKPLNQWIENDEEEQQHDSEKEEQQHDS